MAEFSVHNINRIYLILGNRCNFKCRYCLQGTHCKGEVAKMPSKEVYEYISRLVSIRERGKGKLRLIFWGGEPLLYLEAIKAVVKYFGEKLDYSLVTNGLLLTHDFVEYANEHSISVVLSNDGELTDKTRNLNILGSGDFRDMFLTLKNRGIESVTTAYSYDYQSLLNFFKSSVPDTPVVIDPLKVTWKMPKDLYDIPLDKYEASMQKLADKAFQDILQQEVTEEVRVFLPYLKVIAGLSRGSGAPRCGQFYHALNIDCDGNVYACHNIGEDGRLGNIKDARIKLNEKFKEWLSARGFSECETCSVYFLCKGGCPLEGKEGKEITCKFNKIFFNTCIDLAKRLIKDFEEVDLEV